MNEGERKTKFYQVCQKVAPMVPAIQYSFKCYSFSSKSIRLTHNILKHACISDGVDVREAYGNECDSAKS